MIVRCHPYRPCWCSYQVKSYTHSAADRNSSLLLDLEGIFPLTRFMPMPQ